jgi:hypothetical protein
LTTHLVLASLDNPAGLSDGFWLWVQALFSITATVFLIKALSRPALLTGIAMVAIVIGTAVFSKGEVIAIIARWVEAKIVA